MSPMRGRLGHPFWQAVLVLAGAYVLFRYGVRFISSSSS